MSSISYQSDFIKVESIPGKGKGFVSTGPISTGTLLLEERPLIMLPTDKRTAADVISSVQKLPKELQRCFLELSNALPKDVNPLVGIYKTNVLPASEGMSGVFYLSSRFNHSCCPNVAPTFTKNALEWRTVHPILSANTELFHSYISQKLLLPAEERQRHLLSSFSFQCDCAVCSASFDARTLSDQNRRKIAELKNEIDALFMSDAKAALKKNCELVRLTNEEGLLEEKAFALSSRSILYIVYGDKIRAQASCEEVAATFEMIRGKGEDWQRWESIVKKGAKNDPRFAKLGRLTFTEEDHQ